MAFLKYFFFVFIIIFMIPIVLVIQIETAVMATVLNENYYISTFTGINSQIESAVHSITENNAVLYEVLYNLAISFINSVRNTGFIFAGIGIAIIAAIRIKKGINKPEEQTEM